MNNKEEILRDRIIKLAILLHNKKYVHGKKGPNTFDCAGLIWYIYNEIMGINIFQNGYGLSTTTKIMTSDIGKLFIINKNDKNNLKLLKGDILLIHRQSLNENEPKEDNKYPGHCGLYIGNGKFIHATKVTNRVCISKINEENMWSKKLIGYKRII